MREVVEDKEVHAFDRLLKERQQYQSRVDALNAVRDAWKEMAEALYDWAKYRKTDRYMRAKKRLQKLGQDISYISR